MIPNSIIYAGLAGTLLSLIVATAQQKWQPKVFFLLALRLAIGWQFLFEGMHKIHSQYVGTTDTNRVFTSEPYFKEAPGPVAGLMRELFMGDPVGTIAAKLPPPRSVVSSTEFDALPIAEQLLFCPAAVARELDEFAAKVGTDTTKINPIKVAYARWAAGADTRETTIKYVNGDVAFSGPQRLGHIKMLETEYKDALARQGEHLGNGYGTDVKRTHQARTEFLGAQSDLASDIAKFVGELKVELNNNRPLEVVDAKTPLQENDARTKWFLAIVGACILFGLFTNISCVLAAGFLILTYLTYPPFPWYPAPPNTEGNPLFVNKNLIETFALLALACMPTGRWLGLDALLAYLFRRTPKPTQISVQTQRQG